MPGEIIDRPNPKPLASHIPDSVLSLSVKLEKLHIGENDVQALQDFRRASNYIAAGKHIFQIISCAVQLAKVSSYIEILSWTDFLMASSNDIPQRKCPS